MRRLSRDRRGATLIEFALVAPVMLLLIMGLCDLCYQAYARSILTGAVQEAARQAALEGNASEAATAALDATIVAKMRIIGNDLEWQSSRKTYRKFGDVRAEPFDDANSNGRYDAGECYSDVNDNRHWDTDPGIAGQGGANDVTLYTIDISYPRIFPMAGLMGQSAKQVISASTMLKNQPYGAQSASAPAVRCG